MKSWRSRFAAVGLAVAAAAIAVPLTATGASATAPPGDGWVIAGGEWYPTVAVCIQEELPAAHADGYSEVWCDGVENSIMTVYYR